MEEPETPIETSHTLDQAEESDAAGVPSPVRNGITSIPENAPDEDPPGEPEPMTPRSPITNRSRKSTLNKHIPTGAVLELPHGDIESPRHGVTPDLPVSSRSRNGTVVNNGGSENSSQDSHGDTEARLDALARERALLKDEVSQLRQSLEEIQMKHEEELGNVREQLEDTQGEKEHAETQYRNLLGKVNTIKSQLGERLKADAVSLPGFHAFV